MILRKSRLFVFRSDYKECPCLPVCYSKLFVFSIILRGMSFSTRAITYFSARYLIGLKMIQVCCKFLKCNWIKKVIVPRKEAQMPNVSFSKWSTSVKVLMETCQQKPLTTLAKNICPSWKLYCSRWAWKNEERLRNRRGWKRESGSMANARTSIKSCSLGAGLRVDVQARCCICIWILQQLNTSPGTWQWSQSHALWRGVCWLMYREWEAVTV